MFNIVDVSTRHCSAIRAACKRKNTDVMDVLRDLFIVRGVPAFIRSDTDPANAGNAPRFKLKFELHHSVGADQWFTEAVIL